MKKWWEIRNTGVNILNLLELIGKGYTYEQILKEYPQLTIKDIFYAVSTAHDFIIRYLIMDTIYDVNSKLDMMQSYTTDRHITNLDKWSPDEDHELVCLYQNGARFKDIALILQRSENAVKNRLREIGLYN